MKVSTLDVNNIQSGSKTAKSVADIMGTTGEFKKLLQTKQEESAEKAPVKAASSDKPAKETENAEASVKVESEKAKEQNTGEVKDSVTAEKTVEFYAAQGLRPEMVIPSDQTPVNNTVKAEVVEEVAAIQEPTVSMEADVTSELAQTFENDAQRAGQEAGRENNLEFQAEVIQTAETPNTVSEAQPVKAAVPQQEVKNDSETVHAQTEKAGEYQAEAGVIQENAAVTPQNTASVQTETSTMHVPDPQELPEQLGQHLSDRIATGVQELEIQIEPKNLGKIAIRIAYSAGQATVSVICSEKRTMELIGQNAREIGQLIDRNLGGTTTIVVDEQQQRPDYLNQHREGENRGQQQEQKDGEKNQKQDNREEGEFLQKLRLGLLS